MHGIQRQATKLYTKCTSLSGFSIYTHQVVISKRPHQRSFSSFDRQSASCSAGRTRYQGRSQQTWTSLPLSFTGQQRAECIHRVRTPNPTRLVHNFSAPSALLAPLPQRRLLAVSGPDAAGFLQGLTTANIPTHAIELPTPSSSSSYTIQSCLYSAFLSAKGRILEDVFIYALPSSNPLLRKLPQLQESATERNDDVTYLIEVDEQEAQRLYAWLRRYKLRSKVIIRLLDSEALQVCSAWATGDADSTSQLQLTTGRDIAIKSMLAGQGVWLLDQRAVGLGFRALVLPNLIIVEATASAQGMNVAELPPLLSEAGFHLAEPIAYRRRRYTFGIAEGQQELQRDSALIHESNLDRTGAVDFRKGCYVGQELVIRTEHKGVVRKRIAPCVLYLNDQKPSSLASPDNMSQGQLPRIPIGTDIIYVPSDQGEIKPGDTQKRKIKSVGKWISQEGNVGIALCRLEEMLGIGPTGEVKEGFDPEIEFTFDLSSADVQHKVRVKPHIVR